MYTPEQKSNLITAYQRMSIRFGNIVKNWPEVGCGARYHGWKRGAGMVIEVCSSEGQWEAFLSEWLPEILKDAIVKEFLRFMNAASVYDTAGMLHHLPMCLPERYRRKALENLVARYLLEEWRELQNKALTQIFWVELCVGIAWSDPLLTGVVNAGQQIGCAYEVVKSVPRPLASDRSECILSYSTLTEKEYLAIRYAGGLLIGSMIQDELGIPPEVAETIYGTAGPTWIKRLKDDYTNSQGRDQGFRELMDTSQGPSIGNAETHEEVCGTELLFEKEIFPRNGV